MRMIQSNLLTIHLFKVESMKDYTVQSSSYVSIDPQCTCDPVALQSEDISLAGQVVILYLLHTIVIIILCHSCSPSVCVDVIIIDWTHFSCSNIIFDETETQTSV